MRISPLLVAALPLLLPSVSAAAPGAATPSHGGRAAGQIVARVMHDTAGFKHRVPDSQVVVYYLIHTLMVEPVYDCAGVWVVDPKNIERISGHGLPLPPEIVKQTRVAEVTIIAPVEKKDGSRLLDRHFQCDLGAMGRPYFGTVKQFLALSKEEKHKYLSFSTPTSPKWEELFLYEPQFAKPGARYLPAAEAKAILQADNFKLCDHPNDSRVRATVGIYDDTAAELYLAEQERKRLDEERRAKEAKRASDKAKADAAKGAEFWDAPGETRTTAERAVGASDAEQKAAARLAAAQRGRAEADGAIASRRAALEGSTCLRRQGDTVVPESGRQWDPQKKVCVSSLFTDSFDRVSLGEKYAASADWRIENGSLRSTRAHNAPLWVGVALPRNVRIEFTAWSRSPQIDLKVELFGDGARHQSGYVVIQGGWNNTISTIARRDEQERRRVEKRTRFEANRQYRWRLERTDGRRVTMYLDNQLFLSYDDASPMAGPGQDRFGFCNWESDVFFDDLVITALPD